MRTRRAVDCLFLLLLALAAGCGNNPPTAAVTGTITFEGQTLTSGKVLFLPVGGGKQAIGKIQSDGRFELSTFATGDGALVGEHHGVILKAKAADSDDKLSFEGLPTNNFTVEADKVNDFQIQVDKVGWKILSGS